MPQKNLTSQNASFSITLPQFLVGAIAAGTGLSSVSDCEAVVEVEAIQDEFHQIKLFDPIHKKDVDFLEGPGALGQGEISAWRAVRIRRTDANGGNCYAFLDFREGL